MHITQEFYKDTQCGRKPLKLILKVSMFTSYNLKVENTTPCFAGSNLKEAPTP